MNKSGILDFFNTLSIHLSVEPSPAESSPSETSTLSEEAEIRLMAEVFAEDQGDFRILTPEELDLVVLPEASTRFRSERTKQVVEHFAPNGAHFTVRDLLKAIEDTERRASLPSPEEQPSGPVYFEGIVPLEPGLWELRWDD